MFDKKLEPNCSDMCTREVVGKLSAILRPIPQLPCRMFSGSWARYSLVKTLQKSTYLNECANVYFNARDLDFEGLSTRVATMCAQRREVFEVSCRTS